MSKIGKFAVVLPLSSSISPKSGDSNLMSSMIKSQDKAIEDGEDILTLRKLLRGNSKYFVALIGDTGYDFEDHRVRIFIICII